MPALVWEEAGEILVLIKTLEIIIRGSEKGSYYLAQKSNINGALRTSALES